jgi:MFS transporter, BCD family, chlorophyll transporter
MAIEPLSWLGVIRLGLVQTSLGAIVVLTTSTLNRIMVVEHALPAVLPAALVGLHYAVQVTRPRMGFGSDSGGRRTPWIVGGMAVLALGGIAAAFATALMATHLIAGIVLATIAFLAIGAGVSAAGTTLLVLLAKRSAPHRRAASATIVWIMMIAGFAVTATVAGHALEPYSPQRLLLVVSLVSVAAMVLTIAAVWNVEGATEPDAVPGTAQPVSGHGAQPGNFRQALVEVWSEPQARRFTIFVFISMLAYSGQELILDPFAGAIFNYTPGQSTRLNGLQHGAVLVGMVLVAVASSLGRGTRFASLTAWAVAGCVGSALSLLSLVASGLALGQGLSLKMCVVALGIANGAFAIAAIGQMMTLASQGHAGREGVRMGLWGAAQGIAFGLGGFCGAAASDIAKAILGSPAQAYACVFALEAALFAVSAVLAARLYAPRVSSEKVATTALTSSASLGTSR